MTGDEAPWIQRFFPASRPAVRLACFPHAGGSASFYFPLARALAPTTEFLGVQYPGRQNRRRERPVEDIHELADRIADSLSPWTDRPLAFFGHSMGAVVAFEVARRFERVSACDVPLVLFASGRRAPSTHRDESVHLLDDDGLIAQIKALNGTDARAFANDDLLRMIMPSCHTQRLPGHRDLSLHGRGQYRLPGQRARGR